MVLYCRKCMIEFPLDHWDEVKKVQQENCSMGGTHQLVGR
jgi:hypothetical protein